MFKKISSWSFSRYNVYKQCPYKAKLKFLDKLQEPTSDAMLRGIDIHKAVEAYIRGVGPYSRSLEKFTGLLDCLRKTYAEKPESILLEDSWSFREDWSETTWNDWGGCWLRMKVDCAYFVDNNSLWIYDWKTGKFNGNLVDDYVEQLELFTLGAFMKLPSVNLVIPKLVYLDSGDIYPRSNDQGVGLYTRNEALGSLLSCWSQKAHDMTTDIEFSPNPSTKCQWCHFRAGNKQNGGGQCQY